MSHFVALSFLLLTALPSYQAATVTEAAPPTASRFLELFDRLRSAQQKSAELGRHHLLTFLFSENDVNEYLRYALKTTPRPGLDSLTVKISGNDSIATLAKVDFDAVERWHPGTIPAALRPVPRKAKTDRYRFSHPRRQFGPDVYRREGPLRNGRAPRHLRRGEGDRDGGRPPAREVRYLQARASALWIA